MTSFAAVGWTLICLFAMLLFGEGVRALLGAPQLALTLLAGCSAVAYLLGTYGVLRVHAPEATSLRAVLGLRPTHPAVVLVGCGLGLSLKVPAEAVRELVERWAPTEEAALVARAELFHYDGLASLVGLAVAICLIAPLVEELFFRGALFGRLASTSLVGAAAVSGLLFVFSHPDARDWPSLVLVAGLMSYLRAASGSLLPSIGLHVVFNAAGLWALVSGTVPAGERFVASSLELVGSGLGVLVCLLLLAALSRADQTRRARSEDLS